MKYEFNSSSKNCKVNKIFFKTFLLSKNLGGGGGGVQPQQLPSSGAPVIATQTKQILLKRYDFFHTLLTSLKIYRRLMRRYVVLSPYNRATYLHQTQAVM